MLNLKEVDVSYLLDDPKEVDSFLEDAWKTGDSAIIMRAIGMIAEHKEKNKSQIANETGISRSAIQKVFSESGNPTLSNFVGILKALDIKLHFELA
ncbi:putative addiction module antidote protein [Gluconobacter cerinus]|uniref:addiction module antidote protein n=1 Tax=Gluconobacter cerinus TaxID=38307 RepID=UPI001B8C55B9|nr:addiction module antidote protein [Gluconobacter cerinus]MBS0984339.1 putative addiction module antidote protein [Gluconobacter cerinus]MCW2267242.1 putative addiction module antidote protein [Gluconobacter cerinus]